MLNRLVSRSVFSHAEGIMRPNVFHGNFHQGCQTYGRFHVVGEHEEGSTSHEDTPVKSDTVTDYSHSQLCNSGLEECPAEIPFHKVTGSTFDKSVGLVRITQVGRRNDHVLYLLSQGYQHVSRSGTCGNVCFMLDCFIVNFGSFTG